MSKNASISYRNLRQTIGWLGILLPLMVYLITYFVCNCHYLQDSISHYYYTVANAWFVGTFWGLGLVLIFYPSYKHEPRTDGVLTSIAGFCALCVSLFPTNPHSNNSCAIFALQTLPWRAGVHYASASIMLAIFSYMSIRIFTKTDKKDLNFKEDKWKIIRNYIYIVAGWLTLISIAIAGIFSLIEWQCPRVPLPPKYTYWLEVCALLPFGFAWLVKGGFIFTDDDDEKSTVVKLKNFVLGKHKKTNTSPPQSRVYHSRQ
jgi:hypothetical protein